MKVFIKTLLLVMFVICQPVSGHAQTPDADGAGVDGQPKKTEKVSHKPRFLLRNEFRQEHKSEEEVGVGEDDATISSESDEKSAESKRKVRKNRDSNLLEDDSAEDEASEELQAEAADSVWYADAHIKFDDTVWDFGNVARKGGDVVKNFEFVNDGSKPLVITGITMSCTCIKVDYPKRPVAAGKRGAIKLIYEPHKMSPGTFYRVVQVHSNSVDGIHLLTVSGNSVDARRLD